MIATGATHSYFGHPEWAKFAPGLKTLDDARRIRRGVLQAFEDAQRTEDETERKRCLTFVVIGGGPTGVKLAGAIAGHARRSPENSGPFARSKPAYYSSSPGREYSARLPKAYRATPNAHSPDWA